MQLFYKQIVVSHFYLMVCVRTLKDARVQNKNLGYINFTETVCAGRIIVITLEATRTA